MVQKDFFEEHKKKLISKELETTILSTLVTQDKLWVDFIFSELKKEDFYFSLNQSFFQACFNIYSKNKNFELQIVINEISKILNTVDTSTFDTEVYIIFNITPFLSLEELQDSITRLKDLNKRRALIDSFKLGIFEISSIDKDTNDFCQSFQDKLLNNNFETDNNNGFLYDIIQTEYTKSVEYRNEGTYLSLLKEYELQFSIDKKNLIILGARPATGKTSFSLNVALDFIKRGKKVCFFSLEMSQKQIATRLSKIHPPQLTNDIQQIDGFFKNIYSFFKSSITVGDITVLSKKAKSLMDGLDLIIIDYLQLLTPSNFRKSGTKAEEVAEITRTLKILAGTLDCPILLLSQLSRESEKKERPPMLSDLRDSGAIEQDADIVLFLHNINNKKGDSTHIANSNIDLIIAKNRMGRVGTIPLTFKLNTQTFIIDKYRKPL